MFTVGVIPTWLEGRLIRIGPGLFDIEEGFTVNHFLDGYAMVSKFEIKNGKVSLVKM
jgi:beta,beta-carotene 9',10'-dioxygenase